MLCNNIGLCFTISIADNTLLFQNLQDIVLSYQSQSSVMPSTASVARIARRLVTSKYRNAHVIIFGTDSKIAVDGSLFEILPGGTLICQSKSVVSGSGSNYVQHLLEDFEDKYSHHQPTLDEAVKFVRCILEVATKFDVRTGGEARVFHLGKRGLTSIQKTFSFGKLL